MKILRVITSMDPASGGPCQGIRNLIPELEQLGCVNEVVCLDDPGTTSFETDFFPVHTIGNPRGPWARNPNLAPWLRRHLAEFDAVIIHGLWQYPSFAVTRAIAEIHRRGAPSRAPRVFVMPHGMLDPWFQNEPSRRLKAWRNWAYWKLIEHRTISDANGILFTCQKELELARQPFRPYRPCREFNVGYGVAEPPSFTPAMRTAFLAACPELVNPSNSPSPGDPPKEKHQDGDFDARSYLLFLSRIHPKKGVDVLINAYADMAASQLAEGSKMPDLVIAGPTDASYARTMMALAEQARADAACRGQMLRVHFPGMLSGDAKWGGFYGCEAFVLPSHQENFGIAVVEALACSKPVLISDQVNICDEIERDRAGIIAEDSRDGVVELLKQWQAMSEARRSQMSCSAHDCYVKHFQPAQAAKRLVEAISVS